MSKVQSPTSKVLLKFQVSSFKFESRLEGLTRSLTWSELET